MDPSGVTVEQKSIVDACIKKHGGLLISVLQEIQKYYNYLPKEILKQISERLHIPLRDIYGVGSFYKSFSFQPKGKHIITTCLGTACHVRGAPRIETTILDNLNVELDEMTEDERVSVELVRCVGCCGLAPVVVIDENFHGKLETKDVPRMLKEYT